MFFGNRITNKNKNYVQGAFNKINKRFFKNKITLSLNDMDVIKQQNFLKINIRKSEEINFRNKSFIFDNKTSIDKILSKMEIEYDLQFVLDKDLTEKLENILTKENIFSITETENITSSHVNELVEIVQKLKLNREDSVKFLKEIMEKSELDINNEKHLKILYFNITQEIHKMNKTKKRIDEVGTRRVTLLLAILLLILVVQTGSFYHMIFHVEHLGWDLVEPATFLFGSCLFLMGVFSYIKLHKNAVSGERLFNDFLRSFMMKRYVRDNFNIEKYNSLNSQLGIVKKLIENSQKI